MICLAQLSVIFSLRKSDIAPDGRSDILFAFVVSNARSAYHCRRQYHARSAYHSPQANRVGATAKAGAPRPPLFVRGKFFLPRPILQCEHRLHGDVSPTDGMGLPIESRGRHPGFSTRLVYDGIMPSGYDDTKICLVGEAFRLP